MGRVRASISWPPYIYLSLVPAVIGGWGQHNVHVIQVEWALTWSRLCTDSWIPLVHHFRILPQPKMMVGRSLCHPGKTFPQGQTRHLGMRFLSCKIDHWITSFNSLQWGLVYHFPMPRPYFNMLAHLIRMWAQGGTEYGATFFSDSGAGSPPLVTVQPESMNRHKIYSRVQHSLYINFNTNIMPLVIQIWERGLHAYKMKQCTWAHSASGHGEWKPRHQLNNQP